MVAQTTVTYSYSSSGSISPVFLIFLLAFVVFLIAAMWRTFTKAGKPGWAAIVPIYNYIVMLEIVGRPIWWVLLFFVPFVNFVVLIIVALDMAKSFGKGSGFGVGLVFLSFIFYPILAWGPATYQGPAAAPAGMRPAPPAPPAPPAG